MTRLAMVASFGVSFGASLGAALVVGAAAHAGGGSFAITRYTIDGGGGVSSGGGFTVRGTIGQPDASIVPATGGGFALSGGFWFSSTPAPCPGDFDGDGEVGASDLAILLGEWGATGGSPADLDGNGTVGAPDLAILLGLWGPC